MFRGEFFQISTDALTGKIETDSDFVWLDGCNMVPRIMSCNRQNLQNSSRFGTVFVVWVLTIDQIKEIKRKFLIELLKS